MSLLRRKSDKGVPETDTCNKDLRKGTSEMSAGRKSSGILAAVTPCLQILAIRPMYASESLTQVLLLVWHLLRLLPQLQYVVYDNACGVVRHVTKQSVARASDAHVLVGWRRLAMLKWVVDRLHWSYHRGCRDPESARFVPGVDPACHLDLVGVDTPGCEQVFHIANRWQSVLSNTALVHQ